MSPILVRPVREQLEHDRVIRLLQAKYKRKFEVAINPGNEQATAVGSGADAWYPDLVLHSADKNHKLMGVVEVETAESVNHLEAMSQWGGLSRLQAPFHLYVPATTVDNARKLSVEMKISIAELWVYHVIGDQLRFTLVQKDTASGDVAPTPQIAEKPAKVVKTPAAAADRSAAPAPARAARKTAAAPAARKAKAVKKTATRPLAKTAARPARKAAPAAKTQKRR